jgi:predicted methyltransferase
MLVNHRHIFVTVVAATVLTSAIFAQEVASPKATAEVHESASEIERTKGPKKKRRGDAAVKAKQRQRYLRAIMKKLGIGDGSVIADIGAGDGRDSWVFADVVGASGRVYAEEIDLSELRSIRL